MEDVKPTAYTPQTYIQNTETTETKVVSLYIFKFNWVDNDTFTSRCHRYQISLICQWKQEKFSETTLVNIRLCVSAVASFSKILEK